MAENNADLDGFLPGLAPESSSVPVRPAYEKALARLLSDGVIGDEHGGICASIIALAAIADNPMSKAYARNDALKEAHEQMRTLLDVAARRGDSEYDEFAQRMSQ